MQHFFNHFFSAFPAIPLTSHKDLDIDDNVSHVEGSTTLISAGESDSESENDQNEPEVDIAETPYIQQNEDEFGAVSWNEFRLSKYLSNNFSIFSGWRAG